jgi:hypothetical protein
LFFENELFESLLEIIEGCNCLETFKSIPKILSNICKKVLTPEGTDEGEFVDLEDILTGVDDYFLEVYGRETRPFVLFRLLVFIFHVVGNFWIFLVRFWDDCWNFVCYCI